ncbi:S9 family peptidase [Qipengyuania sp. JC766]|uniref:S9 family peptidase n=1 Tax=Qipengyuania sp. JC766 TaxID=3232139 RepID=UPI003459EC1F
MTDKPLSPPLAAKRPHEQTRHGVSWTDDYAWLRDPGYPEVKDREILAHLEAENAWFEAAMAPHEGLVETLFEEMKGRVKKDDSSVPQKDGDYLYWTEFEDGIEYRKWYRKPVAGGEPTLILDENALAEGNEYFRLGAFSVSQDAKLLAYSVDVDGSERYTVRIRDLSTGEDLPDSIPGTLGSLVWCAKDAALAYCLANDQWRTDNAHLHWLGRPVSEDVELYHEDDEGFRVGVSMSAQEDYLLIAASDHETSEVRFVPLADPLASQTLVSPRRSGREYDIDMREGTIFVLTDDCHDNFRLATAPIDNPGEWTSLIEGSDEFYLTGFELFRDFYVIEGRVAGLDRIEIRYYDDPARIEPVEFPEESFSAGLGNNPEYTQTVLRIGYESMVTPGSVLDFDVASKDRKLLKQQEIPSGYDASLYTTERMEIPAQDGTSIPISILYRKDRNQPGPLHLYGYGAYGIAIDPGFSTSRLSLVDRGMAYAIAHIRGGDDLGRAWYKSGKLTQRTNTFTDFVDVANGLIERGYTSKGQISASGGSAGGELMGAIVNSDPDLWGAVVADVPFVDVLNTMLDATLPLTPGEWPEWGNPITDEAAFRLIRSYSPYDQVRSQAYPPMLVTAGLNDPRVTYWEPAKWVAKLREMKTDDNVLLLKTNMGAGHGGKSGRFASLRETAEAYAFILWQLGIED